MSNETVEKKVKQKSLTLVLGVLCFCGLVTGFGWTTGVYCANWLLL